MNLKSDIVYKRKYLPIITSFLLLVMTLSVSYAFFIYNSYGTKNTIAEYGKIFMDLDELTEGTVLTNLYPLTDEEGINQATSFNFSVSGYNTGNESLYYDVIAIEGSNVNGKTRFNDIDINLYLIDDQGFVLYGPSAATGLSGTGTNLVKASIRGGDENNLIVHNYTLKVWVNDSVVVSSTETSIPGKTIYTPSQIQNKYFSIKIKIKTPSIMGDTSTTISKKIKYDLLNNLYTPVGDTDQTFIVGTASDSNYKPNNYLWYSGKLWRIVALNKTNGIVTSIKIITEDAMTAIYRNGSTGGSGSNASYNGSYIYQWFNEDFYNTLRSPTDFIVTNYAWNATQVSATTKPANTTMITANVGTLNAYEYVTSYTNTTSDNGYLNLGYYWWLINPYSSTTNASSVSNVGAHASVAYSSTYSIRPAINLKTDIVWASGTGTSTDPYRLVGDYDQEADTLNDSLNTRYSGEYVTFNGEIFRIIGIESGLTKIVKADYFKVTGTNYSRAFAASSNYLYSSSISGGTTYWGGYLNTTWYNALSATNKNLIQTGTWYSGTVSANASYKLSICTTSIGVLIANCTKTSASTTANVGLIRMGEMFSAQSDTTSRADYRLLTPYSTTNLYYLNTTSGFANSAANTSYTTRQTFFLKTGVYITDGDGTPNNPFTISI